MCAAIREKERETHTYKDDLCNVSSVQLLLQPDIFRRVSELGDDERHDIGYQNVDVADIAAV